MKKYLLILVLVFASINAWAQCYWAKSIIGSASTGSPVSLVNSVTTDGNGNVFTTGFIANGTFDFDPGPSVFNKTVNDYTCFVSKLDSAGNFVWVKFFGGANPTTGSCRGFSIKTDNTGNVYITGYFSFTIDFDPGVGINNLSNGSGTPDAFICKLDNNGNFIWAKKVGSTGAEYSNSIHLDPTGNVIISGYFTNTSDFDPGAAVFNLTSAGSDDIFILKLDNNGNFLWAKRIGSTTGDRSNSVTSDANGNIISTGYFQGTVDFDPGTGTVNLVSTGSGDIFISKLDPNGNFVFAKKVGGTGNDFGNSIYSDQNGNILTAGNFAGTVDFDPGISTNNLTGTAFNLKLDPNGNFVWANNVGGATNSNSIINDGFGNIYTTGIISQDVYVRKLDSNGNLLMLKQFGGSYTDEGKAITVDNSGGIITTGMFQGTVDFNPDIDTIYITTPMAGNNPSLNIFIHKIFTNVSLPLIISNSPSYCVGNTVTLNATNATSYNWSNSNTSQSINITTSGSFYVTTFNYCYATSLPFNVTFNPLPSNPTIANNGPTLYCQASPTPISNVLTSSNASNYLWSNGESTQSITVTSGGTYTISIVDNNGCQSSSSLTINVSPLPLAVATNSGPFCIGSTLNLGASGGSNYSWTGPGGFTSTLQNPTRANSTTAMSGIYTVTVTNANGCSATASTSVTVNSISSRPNITRTGLVYPCQGDSVILSSNYTFGNIWSNGSTSQAITVTNSGTYWVYHNNGSCNSIRDSIIVAIYPYSQTPNITANGPLTFCQGDSIILTTNIPNNPNNNISWYNGTVFVSLSQSIIVTTPGVYTVRYQYNPFVAGQYYCPSTSSPVTITVLNAPSIPVISASGPLTFCQGSNVTLTSNFSNGNLWSNGSTANAITVTTSGNYSLVNSNGTCSSPSSNPVSVNVIQAPIAPVISASGPLSFCKGNMVTLSANQSIGILWSNGETTRSVDIYDAGTYNLSVSNGVCPTQISTPITITVNDPDIQISSSGQLAENSISTSITFTANVSNVGSNPIYQWYKNGLTVGSNSPNYTNNNWVNGEKIVCRVTSSSGCAVYSNDLFVWLAQNSTDSWQRMADLGLDRNMVPPFFPTRVGAISFSIGNKIYVGLGYNDNHGSSTMPNVGFLSDFWEYNTLTDEWTERAPFAYGNSPRMNAVAFVVNGKGYVGFGQGNSNQFLNDLWEYDPQMDNWTQKSSCPGNGRHSAVSTNVGNSGYVGTGWGFNTYLNDWWKYTPSTNTWTQLTNLPFSNFGLSCATVNNKIYITGSFSINQTVGIGLNYEYNPDNNTWTQKSSMPSYRYYAETFVINDTIFVCGGQLNPQMLPGGVDPCTGSLTTLNEVWAYYPTNDTWIQKSNMKFGKISNGCAASVNGNGYYIGGGYFQSCQGFGNWNYGGYGRETNIKYYAQTDTWELKASLGGLKNYFGFSTTIGNKGYAFCQFSGLTGNFNNGLSDFEVYLFEYDRLNNTWKQKSKYPGQGVFQAGNGFSVNGKIYYGSGASSNNTFVNDFWEYNPSNDTWVNIGNIPIATNKGFSFVLNGKGYIGGGQMGTSFFEFNPINYTWSPRASLPAPPDGNINFSLNNIGYTSTFNSATTGFLHKYDPNNNIWTFVNTLPNYTIGITNSYFSFQTSSKGFYGTGVNSSTSPITYSLFYEFNPSNNTWIQRQNLSQNHSAGGTFSFQNSSYVFNGYQYLQPTSFNLNSMWQYKPSCPSSANTITESACNNFTLNGQTYNQSGTYTQIRTNAEGCDSIITLNLSISNPPNNTVNINGNSLTAVANATSYQWLDCNNNLSLIPGATAQSYQPTSSGIYAVQITNGPCQVTSQCTNLTIVALNQQNTSQIKIYPNPANDYFTIESDPVFIGTNYKVIDIFGRELISGTINNQINIIYIDKLVPGVYAIIGENESFMHSLLKK
jgi:N-acetylneuraminic acid mutarotase